MALISSPARPVLSRRGFIKTTLVGAGALALYSAEVERHWIEIKPIDIAIRALPDAFEGLRIAQLSDIHLDEYTEIVFLRQAIDEINRMQPDLVLLTGDFVSDGPLGQKYAVDSAWQCAKVLRELKCSQCYAVLGNHDLFAGATEVTESLVSNGIPVLTNASVPIERGGSRIWLAGVDDPGAGKPDPELAIPAAIRNVPNEPVMLMSHAPDYVDDLLTHPGGQAVDLVLSGHTHGGQIRLPFLGPMVLPLMGRKYVDGLFRFGRTQLYVNRGLGTVGVPFRFACPPEITLITLRKGLSNGALVA